MYVVGLTGGIGSGKSAVSALFEKQGITVVDSDVVARQVVEPGRPALQEIADHFGPELIQADGSLDRAALRQRIFANADERLWLERLLHPLIREETRRQLQAAPGPYVILASPLLVETGQRQFVQRVLVVDVPEELQVRRAAARDANDEAQIRAVMATQASRAERLSQADDVILNDKGLEELPPQVEDLHRKYCQLAAEHRN